MHDFDGGDGTQSGRHQHLRPVRDNALDEAGEDVEEAGAAARVDVEAVGDVLRDRPCHDEGDGVVGRTEVGEAHEGGDAGFGTSRGADADRQLVDYPFDTAVVAYHLEHSACQEGYDDEFAHAGDALTHRACPSPDIEGVGKQSDDTREQDADEKDTHDVHPAEGGDEDDEVGHDFRPLYRPDGIGFRYLISEKDIKEGGQEGDGERD